ncbi:hypothetical protein BDZ91DRAFT_760825 [Kalaharituber pfeilii]|nr:hypothetical protein BDZ91DRAFT_760825 [Kalaharituber pfeilii]
MLNFAERNICYAVTRGRVPGVYKNASDAYEQVHRFSNGCMRKFEDPAQAREWIHRDNKYKQLLDIKEHTSLQGRVTVGSDNGRKDILEPIIEWKKINIKI